MSDITERPHELRPDPHPEPDQIGRPAAPGEPIRHPDEPPLVNPGGTSHEDFDRDIDIPAVVKLTAGLVVVTILSFVAMWFFYVWLIDYGESRDPEALPQPEAAERQLPPAPRLQATPELELEELRELEERQLSGYGVVDPTAGRARIPIDRAMEIVAERLGSAAAAAEEAPFDTESEIEEVEATEAELPDPAATGTAAPVATPVTAAEEIGGDGR